MTENYEINQCRACGSIELLDILSLGDQYVINFVENKKEGAKCPLNLVLCNHCKLLQLRHNAPPESMWGEQYWYKSGINKMIRDDLKDIVENATKIGNPQGGDIIVDIGSNDGTMLGFYNCPGTEIVGFEPSENVAREASSKGFHIINDFFNAEAYKKEFGDKKAKIITAISMFYDLEDPNKFLRDITEILDKNGLFVIQQNYLLTMLENNAFDNICHEHREYYSLYSLQNLLDKHGLEIFDITLNNINGGSIRTYIKFKEGEVNIPVGARERLDDIINWEKRSRLDTKEPYLEFAARVGSIKNSLLNFLKGEKAKGKRICALGASTRGTVTLQYFGLGPELIDCIFDKNPEKEGKLTIGSWIPVTSPNNIEKYNPDYQLVLIWHIFKGIGEDERAFLNKGGKFIILLPNPKIISYLEQDLA